MSTRVALLLVDAQALDRRAFVRFVETEGLPYDVVTVGSLAEAGTQLARRTFDVALIDQRLGDGVGIDLLPSLLGTPAIILTRPGDESVAAQAVGAGAYGFLVRDSGRRYLQLLAPSVTAVVARRRAEVAAAVRAEEAVHARGDFQRVVTMMWHEVMSPLATLLSTLEMVQTDADENPANLPPDIVLVIHQAVEIATRIERLVTDVLGFYRLLAPPTIVSVDLDTLVDETIASLPRSLWHDTRIEKDMLPETNGDPMRLRVLFRQLFENAYTLRGPAPLAIQVTAAEYDDAVRITVSDNGVGIVPDPDAPMRAPDDPGEGELGLGMVVCRRIVEQHGGRLWLEATSGRGTTVHVALPKAPVAPRALAL